MQIQNELREKVQKEAHTELIKHKQRTANISTRFGKTKLGLGIINEKVKEFVSQNAGGTLTGKILVVVPKLTIIKSWNEDMDKFNYQYLKEHIEFVTYVSLYKRNPTDYDLVVMDEIHSLTHKQNQFLHDYYHMGKDTLGLTGTPPRYKGSLKYRMIQKYAPIKYNYETEEAIDAEILNDYRIIVHLIPLSEKKDIHVKTKSWDFWTSEKASYINLSNKIDSTIGKDKQWAAITRMKKMQTFKSKEEYVKKLSEQIEDKCIIFANTKDQAALLSEHCYYSGNSSNESNLQLFKIGVIDRIACVEQLSEGITVPGLKACILMHSFSENSPKTIQKISRCLSLTTDEMSNMHILCYKNTVEEKWIKDSLSKLDQSKIRYEEFKL